MLAMLNASQAFSVIETGSYPEDVQKRGKESTIYFVIFSLFYSILLEFSLFSSLN